MRSILLALALAAPLSAVAATPTYSNPLDSIHHVKKQQQVVFMTFVNYTSQDHEVRVGNVQYEIPYDSILHIYAPVGSYVSVSSEQNSKVNKETLMQVAATDQNKSVFLK